MKHFAVLSIAPGDEDAMRCKVVALIKADNIDDALPTIQSSQKFPIDFNYFKVFNMDTFVCFGCLLTCSISAIRFFCILKKKKKRFFLGEICLISYMPKPHSRHYTNNFFKSVNLGEVA